MNEQEALREKLLTQLAKLERIDMNVQTNVINSEPVWQNWTVT